MQGQRKTLVTSALVAAGLLLIFLGPCSGRTAIMRRLPPGPTLSEASRRSAAIGTPGNEVTSDATAAIDPDPFSGFQQLKALPQSGAPEAADRSAQSAHHG